MTGVIATPLHVEALAVRSGVRGPDVEVRHTGLGAARSRTAGMVLAARGLDALLVAGVCAGVAPGLRPGDLVVADEVRGDGAPVACAAASELVAALAARGLVVHVGPLVTCPRLVTETARRGLAATDVLAADMESAYLLRAALGAAVRSGRPQSRLPRPAVVRAVVDTADRPLVRPATAGAGIAALRALRRAAPVLAGWVAAVPGPQDLDDRARFSQEVN